MNDKSVVSPIATHKSAEERRLNEISGRALTDALGNKSVESQTSIETDVSVRNMQSMLDDLSKRGVEIASNLTRAQEEVKRLDNALQAVEVKKKAIQSGLRIMHDGGLR